MSASRKITFLISTLSGGGAEDLCWNCKYFCRKWMASQFNCVEFKDEAYLSRLSKKVNLVVLNIQHARFSAFSLIKYIYKYKTIYF